MLSASSCLSTWKTTLFHSCIVSLHQARLMIMMICLFLLGLTAVLFGLKDENRIRKRTLADAEERN